MIWSSIAMTPAAAKPDMISRARLGPVSTPAGCPGSTSSMISVMRLPLPTSSPLLRLITGTHGRIWPRMASSALRNPCEGTPTTTTSTLALARAISPVACRLSWSLAPGRYLPLV